jgi:3-hydroxyacyl-[acyl-carrier-protein] dehydratase
MRWLWIDRILELVPRQRLVAVKNISLAEDHLHDHFPAQPGRQAFPVMPASLIIEGMAQSGGILVGHAESFREKVVLAKVSKAEIAREVTPGFTLRYTTIMQQFDAVGAATTGTVELLDPARPGTAEVIGNVDLLFSHIDRNMAGMEFPAHNFVFSDTFRTLLQMSGIKAGF